MNTDLDYPSDRTALLIVDPYNDFLSEGGKLFGYCRETLTALDTVEHMRQLRAAARGAGVRMFIAPHHRWCPDDFAGWKHLAPVQAAGARGKVFAEGTWGGEFHPDFQPQEGDVVASMHWMSSGFANTDLDLQLRKHDIDRVIICGLRANTCIEATMRWAAEAGYQVTLVKDAIAAFSLEEVRVAVEVNGPSYAAAIVTTEAVVSRLAAAA